MITKANIRDMMNLLLAAYGDKAFPTDNPEKMAQVFNLWTVMFETDEPMEVATAVKDCIATLQFPPKIADIKSRIAQNRMAGQLTEMEAWTIISNAVERSNSREEAQRIFDSLPKIIQRTVGSASKLRAWRSVEDEQFETVIASNCMRSYRTLAQREAGYYALPADMQKEESWRLDSHQPSLALSEPKPKIEYEKPEWMTEIEKRPANPKVEAFMKPITEKEKQRVEDAETRKGMRYLK